MSAPRIGDGAALALCRQLPGAHRPARSLRGAERRRPAPRHLAARALGRPRPAARPRRRSGSNAAAMTSMPEALSDGGAQRSRRARRAICPSGSWSRRRTASSCRFPEIVSPDLEERLRAPSPFERAALSLHRDRGRVEGGAVHPRRARHRRLRPCRPVRDLAALGRRIRSVFPTSSSGSRNPWSCSSRAPVRARSAPPSAQAMPRPPSAPISARPSGSPTSSPAAAGSRRSPIRPRRPPGRFLAGRSRRRRLCRRGRADEGAYRRGRGLSDRAVAHLPRALRRSAAPLCGAARARSQPLSFLRRRARPCRVRRLARNLGARATARRARPQGRGQADRRHPAARGDRRRGRPARGRDAARCQGGGRAYDAGRSRPQRRRPGQRRRHPAGRETARASSATRGSCTSSPRSPARSSPAWTRSTRSRPASTSARSPARPRSAPPNCCARPRSPSAVPMAARSAGSTARG